jgi:uncharacterized membrane protein
MLEKIRSLAMEKLASEEEVNAFMEGFNKVASLSGIYNSFNVMHGSGVGSNILKDNAGRAVVGLGAALVGAAIYKGITSSSAAVENYGLRNKFDMALAQVMSTNRVVKGAKPEKAKESAETLFRFAPHVASDPNLLSSILANAVLGEGIDPMTIKNLVDLEGRYRENNSSKQFPGIKI